MKKPYMPLMMGDWRMLTSGLRADAKGVVVGLFIHQYHSGQLPEALEELALIEPEVGKVWVSIERLFPKLSTGGRANPELEEVRAFWSKQSRNGLEGGRPPKEKPKHNPKGKPEANPNDNPNPNHQYDLDTDTDQEKKREQMRARFSDAFDERTMELYEIQFSRRGAVDIAKELQDFRLLVFNAWDNYRTYDTPALRSAFQHQLKKIKPSPQQPNNGTSKKQHHVDGLVNGYAQRHGAANATGEAATLRTDV